MFVPHYRTCEKHLGGWGDEGKAAFPARIFGRGYGSAVGMFHDPWQEGTFKQHHPFTSYILLDYRPLLKNLLLSKARASALTRVQGP